MRVVAMKSIIKRVVVYARGRDNGTTGFVMCATDGGSLWSKHREGHRRMPQSNDSRPLDSCEQGIEWRQARRGDQSSFEFFDGKFLTQVRVEGKLSDK